MATNIPMNTLEQIIYRGTDLNSFSVAGCEWRKPYTVTIPTVAGVSQITITRTASESNCDQVTATTLTSTGTVLYGDTLSISAIAATGYEQPTATFTAGLSNNKVIGNVTVSVTAGDLKQYILEYPAMLVGVSSFTIYVDGVAEISNPLTAGTLLVPHGSKVYATAVRATGYNNPTIVGVGTSAANATTVTGNITIQLRPGTQISYTATFNAATDCTWARSSMELPYGTTWSINGNVITFTIPGLAAGETNSVSATPRTPKTLSFGATSYGSWNSTASVSVYDYTYTSAPSAYGPLEATSGTIVGDIVFTSSAPSKQVVTFSNTLGGVEGTNSTYSGARTWTISGTNATGSSFTRTFTTTSHDDQYYYKITRNEAISVAQDTTFTPTVTRSVHSYEISYEHKRAWIDSLKIYKNGSLAATMGTTGGSFFANYGDLLYATVSAATGYNTPIVNGISADSASPTMVTGEIDITTTSNGLKQYTVKYPAMPVGVSSFKIYGKAQGSSAVVHIENPGTAGECQIDHGTLVWAEATAASGYRSPTISGIGTSEATSSSITSNIEVGLTAGVAYYTVSYLPMPTGVGAFRIYLNGALKVSNPASAGSFEADHGDKVYATATAGFGYNTPLITGVGTSSATATTITQNVSIRVSTSRLEYTISFTNPAYGSWSKSSMTVGWGTEWSISGRTITFTDPYSELADNTSTNTVSANTPTSRLLNFGTAAYGTWNDRTRVAVYDYAYTTPSIEWPNDKTSGRITANTTFTASNSRANVTFTNSLGGIAGTNSTYSGSHTWTISGTNAAGSYFSRTFTTTAHNAQYYYSISRNSSATQATSNITFTPTVARSVHTYTVEYPATASMAGIANCLIYKNGSVVMPNPESAGSFTASYGDKVYVSVTAASGYSAPTVTGVGTSSSTATTITGNKKIGITEGASSTPTLLAPIVSQISEDWDSDEGYLNYINLYVQNPNDVAVTVYLTAYDGNTVIGTHTANIPANTRYNEDISIPGVIYSVSNGTVSGYCTASGYTNSPTTTVTFNG